MKIPKHFTIHGHEIKVILKEIDNKEDNRYGYYDSAKEEIVIFNKVRSNEEPVILNNTQIEATFWHEVMHAFQWHIKGQTDECEAQSYAGLMIELIKTSELKIDPKIVHEPLSPVYNE